jgi:hypothetical protein
VREFTDVFDWSRMDFHTIYAKRDLVSKDWMRDFDEGSAGAFGSMIKAFENKNPLSLQRAKYLSITFKCILVTLTL